MRALDALATEQYGISECRLMENAGSSVIRLIKKTNPQFSQTRFLIVCGPGNNGGDGFVIARLLNEMWVSVTVAVLGDTDKYRGAARDNWKAMGNTDIPVINAGSIDVFLPLLEETDQIIDGLLGTGISRPVGGLFAEIVNAINDCNKAVISLDIPSGVNGDNGMIQGCAVKARQTVTFGLPKLGNLLYPGFALGGELYHSTIEFPPSMISEAQTGYCINRPVALPPRNPVGHKGTFGKVLVIAGAANYYGAPYFSAMSFLRSGGGYAHLAAPAAVIPQIAALGPEIVFHPLEETGTGSLARKNMDAIMELSRQVDVVILGPGLSLQEETQALVRDLIPVLDKPLILDGDGLTALAGHQSLMQLRVAPTVITPHTGELGRLLGISAPEIEDNRMASFREILGQIPVSVILKGAHSLIGGEDGLIHINLSGNSGMATAGSGDVLTGVLAACFTLGLPWSEAIRTGVFLHGLAGDLAALNQGEDGVIASVIMEALPMALRCHRQQELLPDQLVEKYASPVTI